ncbi:MAG: hypothetical protein DRH24_02220 [Deltaproteobacteria bacterium]|nr:MAG: hypothetical protein DRH24_02220 [Deltaproteobacteria bacterium]
MVIDNDSMKWLKTLSDCDVKFDEPMSLHTGFRVGGPAEVLVCPKSCENLVKLVRWARQREISYLVIGRGTNLLVKETGISGIVIKLAGNFAKISEVKTEQHGVIVTALAGTGLQNLCVFANRRGYGGMNFALGIPGSVGGGITMNAGTACGSMETVLESVKILLPTGETEKIKKEKLVFNYRKFSWNIEENDFLYKDAVILEGSFCLQASDPEKLKKEAREIMKTRKKKEPVSFPNAGCFFKNPAPDRPAGKLIELAGLKGEKVGGAEISTKHANFFINRNRASAADILKLMEIARRSVLKKFNLELEPEVKIVGK